MTDAFALLEIPRRPVVDDVGLKENYFRLAAALHPDAASGDAARFAELQEAKTILENPARRLRHLVQLTFPGTAPVQYAMADGDLFLEVGQVIQRAWAVAQRRAECKSALAQAVLSAEMAEILGELRTTGAKVGDGLTQAYADLLKLDRHWPDLPIKEAEGLIVLYTYLDKWRAQLSEWEFRLAQD